MRFSGLRPISSAARRVSRLLPVAVLAAASAHAQQAPQVLPYTMSTYAGPHATYTPGAACGSLVALDAQGDGCLAGNVSVGVDPHDVRVDGKGFVYWDDILTAGSLIHKINPLTGQVTVALGSSVNTKVCSGAADKYGDGCPATDGAANNNSANLTTITPKAQRGMTIGPNGDIYTAGYSDSQIHKVNALTGLFSVFAGTGTAGLTDGPVASALFSQPRGVGVAPDGTVYVADTANNILRKISNGVVSSVTHTTSSTVKTLADPELASAALLNAPEDVQVDRFGNVYIADQGNAVVRAIYMGSGTLPGIVGPKTGYMYTIAGSGTGAVTGYPATTPITAPVYTYPTDGTTPVVPARSVNLSVRKLSVDFAGNVYIADSSWDVVWFLDGATGGLRLLAGRYYSADGPSQPAAGQPALGCTGGNSIGDGCPGPKASLYANSDLAVSVDNQGNLYITDYEGGAPTSRIRKQLSGLNFPATTAKTSVTQTIQVHFTGADLPAAVAPFTVKGSDYTAGTPVCTLNSDTTTDCLLPITFTPTQPGYDTATLTINSVSNGSTTYLLTGTGVAPAVSFDPGRLSPLTATTTNGPTGVAVDASGNSFVADTGNNRVLMVTASGTTTVVAGTGTAGYTGDGAAATAATLNAPSAVAIDTDGNLYITDTKNNVIRKVAVATGNISTIGGGATTVCAAASNTRGDNCPATQATFSAPTGIVADKAGTLYIADTGNNVLRQINTFGWVSTIAGGVTTVCGGKTDTQGDGCPALSAIFAAPQGLAYDATGAFIDVADTGNSIVRKVSLANAIATTGTAGTATAVVNPATLVAGNGQAGSSIGTTATNTQLSNPQAVAVDTAENVYIADTGNAAIRLVNPAGNITTIAGILASPGSGATPASGADITLTAPAGIAVMPSGNLVISDTGNNRVLADVRSSTSYNFGRILPGTSSSALPITVTSVGNVTVPLPSSPSANGDSADFSLATSTGSTSCSSASLTPGAQCAYAASFTPITTGPYSATYTQGSNTGITPSPAVTLTGTGAILTPTTSTLAQTSPATGNPQYGGTLVLGVTVAAACNPQAPGCTPTGTVRIVLDGNAGSPLTVSASGTVSQSITGLAVGAHTVSCNYSGDAYYSASSCGNTTITVAPATTTAVLTLSANNQPQFATTTLTATVTSNVVGAFPTGSVTFIANGSGLTNKTLGTSPLNGSGVATLTLQQVLASNGQVTSDTTLLPGTYTITCTYSGAANYATTSCPAVTLVVVAQAPGITIVTRGCSVPSTAPTLTGTPNQAQACIPSHGSSALGETLVNGTPAVTTAQGATADAALFITPTNSVAGTLTFACTGLPAHSTCTFSPTSINLTAGTGYVAPIPVDVTLWTDIQSSALTTPNIRGEKSGIELAAILGWPLTLAGLGGIFLSRRKGRNLRLLAAVPLFMLLAGGSLLASGCAGVGDYVPQLTPAGQYPITITVSGANNVTATTKVYFVVTAPGIPGIE